MRSFYVVKSGEKWSRKRESIVTMDTKCHGKVAVMCASIARLSALRHLSTAPSYVMRDYNSTGHVRCDV
jgi:hypothetical protein